MTQSGGSEIGAASSPPGVNPDIVSAAEAKIWESDDRLAVITSELGKCVVAASAAQPGTLLAVVRDGDGLHMERHMQTEPCDGFSLHARVSFGMTWLHAAPCTT